MKVDIFGWHQELSEGISSIKLDFWQHRTMKRITPDVAAFKVRINGYASRNACGNFYGLGHKTTINN